MLQEYRPAFGYKRANDETKQWLIEVPQGTDPYEDQFAKLKAAKKERIAKNELQRLRNIARNNKSMSLHIRMRGLTACSREGSV